MHRLIIAPKWKEINESLARLLQVNLAVITLDGDFLSMHNPGPLFSRLNSNSALLRTYCEFCRSMLRPIADERRIVTDPLGLLVAGIPVGSDTCLLMCGGLDADGFGSRQKLSRNLEEFGIDRRDCARVPTVTRAEFDEKVDALMQLYGHLGCCLGKAEVVGDQVTLLAAVDEIDKLMVGNLNPAPFDLPPILNLVASSLIILFDAEGSCIFTRNRQGESFAITRGRRRDLLEDMRVHWLETMDVDGQLEDAADGCVRAAAACGVKLKTSVFQRAGNTVFSGVINATGEPDTALSIFSRQVLIAMEVAFLHRALQQQIGMLLNSLHHGIIVANRRGEVMLVNRAAVDSLGSVGIRLATGQLLIGAGLGRLIERALLLALEEGTYSLHQQSSLGGGEASLHLRWEASPLRWDDEVLGVVLLFEDATELVNLRHQMYNRDKLATAGEVAAGLAHEIRNPLATARAAVQLLEMTPDEKKEHELHSMIASELDRIDERLSKFLEFAKPGFQEDLTPVDVGEVMREVEFMVAGEAHLHGVEIRNRLRPGDLPPALAEVNRLRQVFLNICKNAVAGMEEGGLLEVSAEIDDRYIWMGFCDNGPGIPDENLENLVRPFFTTKLTGTGLGLSISSAIVRELGGELRIESQSGAGTTVYVGLPPDSSQVSHRMV